MESREHFAWVEKYRPRTLDECILPETVKATFVGILAKGDTPNLLFHGQAGVGKTSVAKVLTRVLDVDEMVINASDTSGIDLVRDRIKDFASNFSPDGRRKYVILDEADNLQVASTQPALRSFMEQFARHCGFILTVNHLSRIIPPLQSRCSLVDFRIPTSERPRVAAEFAKRVIDILNKEHIKFKQPVVLNAVQMYFPDYRRILNELQRWSISGELSEAILSQLSNKDITDLMAALKSKEYNPLRDWVLSHEDMDENDFYRMMYDQLPDRVEASSRGSMIIILADYSYKVVFCADKQLNILACLLDIQNEGRFK